ncbi:hypothetical protein C365_02873 [Cryptococcus neoformans Bt85]|nr:hypothetical protein C365_02873 [Cryptococcus neoformans var. grubii Bt85]
MSMRHRRQRYTPPSLALVPVLVLLIFAVVAEVGEALEHGRGGTGVERRVHNQTRRRAMEGKKRQFNLISELESLGSNVPNSLFDLLAPTTSTESLTSQLVSSTESTSSVQSSTQSVATPVVESSTNLVQSIATSAPSFETSSTVDVLATSAAVSPSATLSSSSDESSSTWQSKVAVESTSSIVYAVASDQATSTSYSSETTSSYSPVASSSSAAASSTSSFEYSSETFSPAPSTASIPISSAIELSTKSSTPVLISQQSSASPSQTVLTTPEAIAVSIISSESEVPTTSTQTAAIYVSESGTPSPSGNDVPLTTSEAVVSSEVASFNSALGATTSLAASSFGIVEPSSVASSLGEAVNSFLGISTSISEAAITIAASSTAPPDPLSTSVFEPASVTSEAPDAVPSSSEILPVSDNSSNSNVFSASSIFTPSVAESSSYVEPSDASFMSGALVGTTSSPEPSSSTSAVVDDTTQVVNESVARMAIPIESASSSIQTFAQTTVPTTVSATAYAGPSSSIIESSSILPNDPEPSLSSSQTAVYNEIISQAVSSSLSGEKSVNPSSSAQMSVSDSASGSVNQATTSASDYTLSAVAPVSTSSTTISSSKAESSESEANISGMVNITAITSAPAVTGSQVMTFDPVTSSSPSSFDEWSQSSTNAYTATSSIDGGYTPTQTWLIVASTASSSYQATSAYTSQTASQSGSGSSSTTASPSIASIPSSMPTLIVPGNSVANNAKAGTGSDDDPIKGDTLIAILLAAEQYPWWFVVESSDATSQLFNTFPTLISNALEIDTSEISTYGLQVYQPASWDGDETSLLTQYMAYLPSQYFDTLNAYIQTASSPLYNQSGIEGQLAAQINTAFPLAAASDTAPSSSSTSDSSSSSKKKRNIIIGVCVGVGGALWIALVWWVYKRTTRSNDKAVHKRLSEHMSMFPDHRSMSQVYQDGVTTNNGWVNDRRVSRAPSIAASEIDDRPSSFYASPLENDRSMRDQQRGYNDDENRVSHGSNSGSSTESPHSYGGHSVFGSNWSQNPHSYSQNPDGYQSPTRSRMSQNPFEDMVTRSYLGTAGMNAPMPKRRSALSKPKPVNKALISQPTLQGNSLEFRDYGSHA